ncbi:MAG TPA: hypothetical protein VGF60_04600 [Xanthobacteraceae bacterium]|jgi:hypothetical protein
MSGSPPQGAPAGLVHRLRLLEAHARHRLGQYRAHLAAQGADAAEKKADAGRESDPPAGADSAAARAGSRGEAR